MEKRALTSNEPTTAELLDQCSRGDREAMHTFYVENQRCVFSIALNYFGGRREIAEDVTQKVFLKIFTNCSFRGDSKLSTWLYRVTVNACTDEARKLNRFVDLAGVLTFGEPKGGEVQQLMTESEEISGVVAAQIAKLRPKLRAPIVLKYVEGLSYNEIAEVLGCSIGTVASRMNRGHKQLAARLEHLRDAI